MFDFKDHDRLRNNIKNLSGYIDRVYLKDDTEKVFWMKQDFTMFVMQIEGLYRRWFPRAKSVSELQVVEHLFKDIFKKDEKLYVKYGTQCLIQSSKRVFAAIEDNHSNGNKDGFIANVRLLNDIAFEAPIFLDYSFKIMDDTDFEFGHGKRFQLHPREVMSASQFLLRQYIPQKLIGDFAIPPTAAFLIRQAIELWLQAIFGIHSVWDENVKVFVKVQPERLFKLLDDRFVALPVPKSAIEKIHAWTQRYVHTGRIEHVWEVEHAQVFLAPIFMGHNVIIERSYYDGIESHLQQVLKNAHLRINRRDQHSSTIK